MGRGAKGAWLVQTLPHLSCPQPEQSLLVFLKHLALQSSAPPITRLLLITPHDTFRSTCPPRTLSHLQHPPPGKPTLMSGQGLSIPFATTALATHWHSQGLCSHSTLGSRQGMTLWPPPAQLQRKRKVERNKGSV